MSITLIDPTDPEGRAAIRAAMARLGAPRNKYDAAARAKAKARGQELREATDRSAVAARHQAEDDAATARFLGDDFVAFLRSKHPTTPQPVFGLAKSVAA